MYTVSKGPSKIVAKTRRGITQKLERLENLRDNSRKTIDTEEVEIISVQKPIFHMNGQKKSSISRSQQEAISPQHEEIIKFIYESWNSVCKECEKDCDDEENKSSTNGHSHPSIVYYEESEPNNHLQDFTPFDLESWWGKRLFNTITKSIP